MSLFKSLLSVLSAQSPVHIWFVTLTSGAKHIGDDQFGNRYFEAKPRKDYKRPRRWVLFRGEPEATKIPPEWHGWIHFQTNTPPSDGNMAPRRSWQKPHQPNQTGTINAYRPDGHLLKTGNRPKATGDYQPWLPPQ